MSEFNLRDLKKSQFDCKIAGVCGGFGEHTPMPSWLWRAIFVCSLFLGGFGLFCYIIFWICMPNANTPNRSSRVQDEIIQKEI